MMIDDRSDVKMTKLTAHILDDSGFVFPSNENKVNRDCSGDDAKSNSCKTKIKSKISLMFPKSPVSLGVMIMGTTVMKIVQRM